MLNAERLIRITISIIGCELLGTLSAIIALPSILSWYNFLAKPSFIPSTTVLGAVWVVVFAIMGLSVYLVEEKGIKKKNVKAAMNPFGAQLGLMLMWALIFFGYKSTFLAFIDAILLWLATLLVIVKFYKVSKPAAYLMVPTFLWISFAIVLNYYVWILNLP